jgi:hypothetical protein
MFEDSVVEVADSVFGVYDWQTRLPDLLNATNLLEYIRDETTHTAFGAMYAHLVPSFNEARDAMKTLKGTVAALAQKTKHIELQRKELVTELGMEWSMDTQELATWREISSMLPYVPEVQDVIKNLEKFTLDDSMEAETTSVANANANADVTYPHISVFGTHILHQREWVLYNTPFMSSIAKERRSDTDTPYCHLFVCPTLPCQWLYIYPPSGTLFIRTGSFMVFVCFLAHLPPHLLHSTNLQSRCSFLQPWFLWPAPRETQILGLPARLPRFVHLLPRQ